jgi:CheY-like chemotaxis protein/HPt (histidine-containing phosphotransfer) domain-containing protein
MLRLTFEVVDTGIGIAPEMLDVIFESFRQADSATSRKYGGTGLGLAISRELATLMGGDIRVESSPGQGSRFIFSAPFALGREAEAGRPAPSATRPARALRVLVAEDNPVNVKLMIIHLKKLGHVAVPAATGEMALSLLADSPFDLVLMDIEMPSMDGLTAAKYIRSGGYDGLVPRDPDIPIVAVTAHVSPEVRQACADAGMNDYVSKPVNLDELAAMITRLTEARRAGTLATPRPAPQSAAARAPSGVLDVDWAIRRMGIDQESFGPILAVSLGEFQHRLDAAGKALAKADMAELALCAHTLKSTAAAIGAGDCLALAVELEQTARSGLSEPAKALLSRLETAFSAVMIAVGGLAAKKRPRP